MSCYCNGIFRIRNDAKHLMNKILIGIVIVLALPFLIISCNVLGFFGDTVSEARQVAQTELGPKALNAKYEWFKNCIATLNAKRASIANCETSLKGISNSYAGQSRTAWSRIDLEEYNLRQTELNGMISSYNQLASQYNSEMSKWHTAFLNAGKIPAGGTNSDGVTREVAEYIRN